MTATADPTATGEVMPPGECWCCGTATHRSNMLRLNQHREVTVCLGCADYLALRANERRDTLRPSLAGSARDVLRAARRLIVDHGWHQLPVIGPVLRWIGRFTP